ncbi:glycoside hydrolase family 27 protein [Humibacter sp. RRB41]|uniref:glycoside hydrolase family 27 protein n=1 Tax=Humibacter sp. RRB41 TaxID=2919946 RepID=UPI001FAAC524|nr:glycoside hydrolase family 27 protein [Humibacter sp. RRB41]
MRNSTTLSVLFAAALAAAAAWGTAAPAAAAPVISARAATGSAGSATVSATASTSAIRSASDATPPMGWNSYNAYACDNGAQNMEAVAKFIHDSGLEADGYSYVNSDGCYDDLESLGSPNTYGITAPIAQNAETCGAVNGRLPDGELYVNSYDFPPSAPCANDGFKLVGDDLHSLGLKLGLYYDASNNWNCEEIPGSYGFDQTDAATLSSWGADYVKLDWGCGDDLVPPASNAPSGYTGIDAAPGNEGFGGPTFSTNSAYDTNQEQTQIKMYTALVKAIRAQKRPITVSIAGAGTVDSQTWGLALGDLDRPTGDANANFTVTGKHAAGSVVGIVNADAQTYESLTGPGHWVDPDAMEVGNGSLTEAEDRSEMSMFSEMAEPLLMSTNLCPGNCGPDTTPATKAQLALAVSVFGNKRVIAVDQDALGSPAHIAGTFDGTHLTMTRKLKNGDVAVTMFNESTTDAATMSATAADLGLPSASRYSVQDLWTGATTTSTGAISATVAPTQTVMYRISPVTGSHGTGIGATRDAASATAARASSTHPTNVGSTTEGSAANGSTATVPANLTSVSCASAIRCAGVDEYGAAVVFDPAHPSKASRLSIDPGQTLAAVSCPKNGADCTAVDGRGVTFTFGVSGRGPVSRHAIDQGGQPTAIDCITDGQCTVVDGKGVEVTFNPANGRTVGRGGVSVDPNTYLAAVSCPSSTQCTAAGGGGNNGDTEVTFNPKTGAVATAGVTSIDADTVNGVSAVSCPSVGQCTVVDGAGDEVTFVPSSGTVVGSGPVALEGADLAAGLGVMKSVSCMDAGHCVAVDLSGKAVAFDPATGVVAASGAVMIDGSGTGLESVTCVTASVCVAVDLGGREVTFAPTGLGVSHSTLVDQPVRWRSPLTD